MLVVSRPLICEAKVARSGQALIARSNSTTICDETYWSTAALQPVSADGLDWTEPAAVLVPSVEPEPELEACEQAPTMKTRGSSQM